VAADTHRENVPCLHRDCPLYRAQGFRALGEVEIGLAASGERPRHTLAVLAVVDDGAICPPGTPGLNTVSVAPLIAGAVAGLLGREEG